MFVNAALVILAKTVQNRKKLGIWREKIKKMLTEPKSYYTYKTEPFVGELAEW